MYCGTAPLAVDLYQTFPCCRQNTALSSLVSQSVSCLVLPVAVMIKDPPPWEVGVTVCKYLQVRIYLGRMGSCYNYREPVL